jgi:hypothetical protein
VTSTYSKLRAGASRKKQRPHGAKNTPTNVVCHRPGWELEPGGEHRPSRYNSCGGAEEDESGAANNGIVTLASLHSVEQKVEKIEEVLRAKVIFGSPKGTPLMLASPSIAIDLPLRILV